MGGAKNTFSPRRRGRLSSEPRSRYSLRLSALRSSGQDEPGVASNIDLLNELHDGHYTRYPKERATPVPDASVIADLTVDHLIFTLTQIINPR